MTAGSADMTAQAEGDVSYQYYDTEANDFKSGTKASTEYTVVAADTTTFEKGKWYVVNSNVTVSQRIKVEGTAQDATHLILCDGATLTANGGIAVPEGKTLNVYPGSASNSVKGTGILTAKSSSVNAANVGGDSNGIDCGTVVFHGGVVDATGGSGAAGIGGGAGSVGGNGGTVTIYGGKVTAAGSDGAGIGGGYGNSSAGAGGTVKIYGGEVSATGSYRSAGIGGGSTGTVGGAGGKVTIYGGTVTATGGGLGGAGIGAGYCAGDSNDIVEIYGGNVNAKSIGQGYGIGCYDKGGVGAVHIYGGNVYASTEYNDMYGIGHGLTVHEGVTMEYSFDNNEWLSYTGTTRAQYMRTTPSSYSVALSGGANATRSGAITQSVTQGQTMATVTYTASTGYSFPATDGAYGTKDGVTVAVSQDRMTITVSGTPTADVAITIPDAISDLDVAKADAKAALASYRAKKTDSDYDTDGITALDAAKTNGDAAIEAATVVDTQANPLDNGAWKAEKAAEEALDAIKTQAQKEAEALAAAKTAAKGELDTLQNSKNEGDYDVDDWTTLTQAIADGKTAIDNATTTEAVNTAKGNATAAVNAVKTKAQKEAEALAAAKTAAKAALASYRAAKADSDYDADGVTALNEARTNGDTAIEAATVVDTQANPLDNGAWKAEKAAEEALDAVKTKAQKDQDAADSVSAQIAALPAAESVTTADKEAIEAARTAYNALTDNQKAKVDADTLEKLEDAEGALAVAKARALIDALPAAESVTAADENAIEAAREAYDNLTADQKANIPAYTLKRLTDAEDALAVAKVVAQIDALPVITSGTDDEKAAVEGARAAYDALTAAQKADVLQQVLAGLAAAEAALAKAGDELSTQGVIKKIESLPAAENVSPSDRDAIVAARAAYNALDDAEKPSVTNIDKLAAAETALEKANKAAADAVTEKIDALPATISGTEAEKEAIEDAQAAYDNLTYDQKAEVSNDAPAKLANAENGWVLAYRKAQSDAAEALVKEGDSDDAKALVAAAKDAINNSVNYDAGESLDEFQDAVDAIMDKLETDLKDMADKAAVKAVADKINALPKADKVTTDDKAAIQEARAAYDALTMEQKALLDEDPSVLAYLLAAEKALEAAEKNATDTAAADAAADKIDALPAADKVTVADKAAIEAARAAYNALTPEQKAILNEDPSVLAYLLAAEEALAKAEEQAAAKVMHRLYNPNSGEHFYTSNEEEYRNVVAAGWNDEGIGWTAPTTSGTPVYRLYNQYGGEHHYTTSKDERDYLVSVGWNDEGIGWYSDDAKSVPLYRQYNPNQFACNHNYTTSKEERDWLVGLGWRDEGIGWYGLS